MKRIILIIILIVKLNIALADCSSSGMTFFPINRKISLNPTFIVQGYDISQQTILSFEKRNVYLESLTGEKINLKLIEILKGQMNLTQAIFKVESQLKPNTKYFMKYSNETNFEISERKRWNQESKKSEEIFWETTEVSKLEILDSNLNIEFYKTEVIHYGCGPSANAIFKINNSNKLEIWYKTELIEISTNMKTLFYVISNENKLNIGHGMCSGGFTFKDKGKYKVRFIPMNADGEMLKTTNWITFESPFVNDNFNKIKLED